MRMRSKTKLPFKVAVVGGGPVGLSAAHDLALMGYSVTIFEAAPVAGGMLYLGIPEYRLPRDVVEAQVREILGTGDITLKLNHRAGRDFQIADLRQGVRRDSAGDWSTPQPRPDDSWALISTACIGE
jgi:NADPH-dependent glutamate synthase beta subunit-like oxidoreductase